MNNRILLEICAASVASAVAAEQGGANRVELCTALGDGGLTPGYAAIKETIRQLSIPVRVLIRPRAGDFLYTTDEIREMCLDIRTAIDLGAEGVVCGALNAQGDLDMNVLEQLLEAAKGGTFTFHRAFDLCRDPFEALEQIKQMGIDTILTSGQAQTAIQGIPLLKDLSLRANQGNEALTIMAGCGLHAQNITGVITGAGLKAVHLSARKPVKSRMLYQKEGVCMGSISATSEYDYFQTDLQEVKACREALDRLEIANKEIP